MSIILITLYIGKQLHITLQTDNTDYKLFQFFITTNHDLVRLILEINYLNFSTTCDRIYNSE